MDVEDERLSESYSDHEFFPETEAVCAKTTDVEDERLSESYSDHEFFPETEAVSAKSMDTKDEWLSESDTDGDFSAENVELVSHGHSHSEIWSTTLEGAVNLKDTQIVNSGLNWLSELKKGAFPSSSHF